MRDLRRSYVYMAKNLKSGRRYIGRRLGAFDPKYFGSGVALKAALASYGSGCFTVKPIYFGTHDELNRVEKFLINEFDAVESDGFYNLAVGGDAWGSPMTLTTRRKISAATNGRVAHNRGKPNETARLRMLNDNPMKNPAVAKAVGDKQRGRSNGRAIVDTFAWQCEKCGLSERRRSTVKQKRLRFCGKSCAAAASNTNRAKSSECT